MWVVKTKIGDLEVNYSVYGKGEVLVLLHGWGVDSTVWQSILPELARKVRVVTIDLPGFGQSQAPKSDWNLEHYARIVTALFAKLNFSKINLLGHSFGGRVAIKIASSNNHQSLERLILVDSAGIKKYKMAGQNLAYLLAKGGGMLFNLKLLKILAPIARKILYNLVGEHDYERAGNLKNTFVNIISEDLRADLARVDSKTLIIWGEDDYVTPIADAYLTSELIKNSKLKILPGCGHFPFVDRPVDFVKVVADFVKK